MRILKLLLLGAAFASLPLPAQTIEAGARVPSLQPLQAGSLHNLHRYHENVLGGSSPESPEDFAALAKLGVKIVVSVDGLRPNVEEAAKHGLAYAHVPFGYDGVPESARLQLIKTFRSASGPIYVHCHHGKHRGPAAIGCMLAGDGQLSPEDAVIMLKAAGTSPDYPGLYRDVADIQLLDEGASLAKELERGLQAELAIPVLERRMNALKQNCATCHKRLRN